MNRLFESYRWKLLNILWFGIRLFEKCFWFSRSASVRLSLATPFFRCLTAFRHPQKKHMHILHSTVDFISQSCHLSLGAGCNLSVYRKRCCKEALYDDVVNKQFFFLLCLIFVFASNRCQLYQYILIQIFFISCATP